MIPQSTLDELEKAAEAATQSKWCVSETGVGFEIDATVDGALVCLAQTQMLRPFTKDGKQVERRANAKFIASADPTTILELLSEVKNLRKSVYEACLQNPPFTRIYRRSK